MSSLLKTIVSFMTISILIVMGSHIVSANQIEGTSIQYESVNPDSPFRYTFKRAFEKIEGIAVNIFDKNGKTKHMIKLSNARLAESLYIIDKDKQNYIETSISRYISQLGLISEQIEANKSDSGLVKSNLDDHIKALTVIKDKFPAQSAQWLMIQQAFETAKVTESKASQM